MSDWPSLQYADWNKTLSTLHRWVQLVGKLKTSLTPWTNHSWHSALAVTARGLTTGAVPLGDRILTVDIDFLDHKILFQDCRGSTYTLALLSETVASFYGRFRKALECLEIPENFDPHPNECPDYVHFGEDIIRDTYVPSEAQNFFQVLARVNNVFQIFRSRYVGKCSPVHFFWGSFDLAVTRFSGRLAPEHPGQAPHISPLIMKEAYSHEVSSCGFWPGNELYPKAAFYSYAYPMPRGFPQYVKQKGAVFVPELGEYILPYEEAIAASDPRERILRFIQETYLAAAKLGSWDRERLEESPYLQHLQSRHERVRDSLALGDPKFQ